MSGKTIAVTICSRNRETPIKTSLDSLFYQEGVDPSRVEVLVIDNGSTDNTYKVACEYIGKLPFNTRVVQEPRVGLSVARNRAIEETDCDIILYLDDDATALPTWIAGHLEPYDTMDGVSGVTGRIIPVWKCERPSWVDPAMDCFLGCVDLGDDIRELVYPESPSGGNMSFTKKALVDVGGFDERFGFGGSKQVPFEDNELAQRMHLKGFKIFYHPQASVYHDVPADKMNVKWFINRIMKQGQGAYMMDVELGSKSRIIRRAIFDGLLKSPPLLVAAGLDYITGNRARASKRSVNPVYMAGYLREMFRTAILRKS